MKKAEICLCFKWLTLIRNLFALVCKQKFWPNALFLFSRFKITSRYEDDQSSDGQSGGQTPGAERGGAISAQMQQHQQYLGDIAAGMPELPDVEIDDQQGMWDVF